MPARHLPGDEPFFREWNAHHGPYTRSRSRAKIFARAISLDTSPSVPVIGVVGSKGKGSAVAATTQYLMTLGYTVGTISSPPFLTNRERIRLNAKPLPESDYNALASRVSHALTLMPPVEDTGGYLAPTGLFTLAGADYLLRHGVDALVIEEGLGGATDEISQFRLDTLVVTPVFLEHEGVIGDTVDAIARNLVGAGDEHTREVVFPETLCREAREAIDQLLPNATRHEVSAPKDLGFGPLTSMNVATGYAAASVTHAALQNLLPSPVQHEEAFRLAGTLHLPGRSSLVYAHGTRWLLDAAISREGVASALENARSTGQFDDAHTLVCMPDIKDIASILDLLEKDRTILATTHEDHLFFENYPSDWETLPLHEALATMESRATSVIALGTMSFAAEMAAYLELDTEHWISPGSEACPDKATK